MIGSSDSDSDDDKRVVRSAKDRRFDELKATCEELRVTTPVKCMLCTCSASHGRTIFCGLELSVACAVVIAL